MRLRRLYEMAMKQVEDTASGLKIQTLSDTVNIDYGDHRLGGLSMMLCPGTSLRLWSVRHVGAKHGYGPLLYDVAMEWATLYGDGLMCDYISTSKDAKHVWDYYRRRRPDVTCKPIPQADLDGIAAAVYELGGDLKLLPPALRFYYAKEPTQLTKLGLMS